MLTARRIPRPSAALVVAFAALFTAMGGTGYAALMITGANVANSSLTGLDIKNKSLGWKEHKPNSLGGGQIKETLLGTVPSAQHAATADNATNATNATNAAKAADADTVGGIAASGLMTTKTRAFESSIAVATNFANNAVIGGLGDLQPGVYVVSAKLTYDNDGAAANGSCTLQVPGSNDTTSFALEAAGTEAITLQEVVTSEAVFNATVTCESDGIDDTFGTGSIIAVRLD